MPAATNARHPQAWPEHIRARYGVTPPNRWVPFGLAALGTVFALAVMFVSWRLAYPPISTAVVSYATRSDDHLSLTFQVVRRVDVPVECAVRARAADGFDVAYAVVSLPPGTGSTQVTYELRTSSRALLGELLGCGSGRVPPGTVGAQFRPGVLPPAQPWAP